MFQVTDAFYDDTKAYKKFNLHKGHMAPAGNHRNDEESSYYSVFFNLMVV